jgi:PAS domain S-box-containing protein
MPFRSKTLVVAAALILAMTAPVGVAAGLLATPPDSEAAESTARIVSVPLIATVFGLVLSFGPLIAAAIRRTERARIAELTRHADEMKSAHDALAESEARFRTMVDQAPVLLWLSDPVGGRTFFNDGWLRFTGRDQDAEIGFGWTAGVHPEDRPRCLSTVARANAARTGYQLEYRLRRPDYTYGWVLEQAVPRTAEDGRFIGFAGSCFDTTERQQLEAQLQDRKSVV